MSKRFSPWPWFSAISLLTASLVFATSPLHVQAQTGVNPLSIYQNYFVTGDYVVSGWIEGPNDGKGFSQGYIKVPDDMQAPYVQPNVPTSVPVGADIVAAYLYWATVESNTSTYAGQSAFFNGYPITGVRLGNPNAPTSWSSGGCSGSSQGSKTMRTYRADVRPFLPLDNSTSSPTFGTLVANGKMNVALADSGSNGNTAPMALGATLVIIYRVWNPGTPLNSIVLYDGAFAPSNTSQSMSQLISGFYDAAVSNPGTAPVAKLTQIVANGQPNKSQSVSLTNDPNPLPSLYTSLYGASAPPFPGLYGSWDNPTWVISNYVNKAQSQATTTIAPTGNKGCVSWGTIIMSTPVEDSDGDGLLDSWENAGSYVDAVSGQTVQLPGANPGQKDLYVELDWLDNLNRTTTPPTGHTHLPTQVAIDTLGNSLANNGQNSIKLHLDLGPNVYPGDPYVIPGGTGGNAIPESQFVCNDTSTSLCAYPGKPATAWKGGFEYVKNTSTLGNFQDGRSKSYHYVLFGHALGSPRYYWSTLGADLDLSLTNTNPLVPFPQLTSVTNNGNNTATIVLHTPSSLMVKPGDITASTCTIQPIPSYCGDGNLDRVGITGAIIQTGLNGTYHFTSANSVQDPQNPAGFVTTVNITTSGWSSTPAVYNFSNEPQLAVTYLGPTSSSGQSEVGGGGDSLITLGLWGADDPLNCVADTSQPLSSGQVYCANNVGTVPEQTGTLMHELGHSMGLTHGGIFFKQQNQYPNLPWFELNCKPNYLSIMNYLFQVRGFVDGGFDATHNALLGYDYSGQTLQTLTESSLYEGIGLGSPTAAHLTRWYSIPTALQAQTIGASAKSHCDGTPLRQGETPEIRVDASVTSGGNYSAPLDWNNDGTAGTPATQESIDVNYNGLTTDSSFSGYNDLLSMNLQQIGARSNAFNYSGGGVNFEGGGVNFEGGGVNFEGGGVDNDGGGVNFEGGGVNFEGGGVNFEGGGVNFEGGGIDQTEDLATSTADPPTGLLCTIALPTSNPTAPACTLVSGNNFTEASRSVPLSWKGPGFGQTRRYTIYRSTNGGPFTALATITGAPPVANYIDTAVQINNTYTYFVTDANKQGAISIASNSIVVKVTKGSGR